MTVSFKHAFASAKADGTDTSLVQPSDWNAEHLITMAGGTLLGRASVGSGEPEELTPASYFDLTGPGLAITPLGIATSATTMGTYTGSTLTDNQTIKVNIQELETAVEARATTAALAATTGAALIGKTGGGTVQDAITAFADVVRGDPASPSWSLFVGTDAGNGTTTSLRTTALGVGALQAVTSGNLNTAVGSLALNSNTSGAVNTAVGADALGDNTTGEYNNAFGCKALVGNTTGSRNNAFGQSAMLYANTGNDNCAFGQDTMIALASGSRNCAYGNRALTTIISGVDNCAFGANALYYSTANNNCAFGKDAMFTNSTGASNNAIGYQALYSNTTGNNNAALGQITLYGNTTGTGNTGLGHRAGYGAAGDEATTVDTNCTFIGINASRSSAVPTATVLTNSTAIGNDSKFTKSNQVSLGDNAVTEIRAPGPGFLASTTNFTLSKTSTAGGTTGAQTINKPAGSVNFAAAATSLVVTNTLVTTSSIIIATVNTNDSTMKTVLAVPAAGSFTLHANAAATAETRVSFLVIN